MDRSHTKTSRSSRNKSVTETEMSEAFQELNSTFTKAHHLDKRVTKVCTSKTNVRMALIYNQNSNRFGGGVGGGLRWGQLTQQLQYSYKKGENRTFLKVLKEL